MLVMDVDPSDPHDLRTVLIVGPSGSGKTTMALNRLFNQVYGMWGRYELIIIISKSCCSDVSWAARNPVIRALCQSTNLKIQCETAGITNDGDNVRPDRRELNRILKDPKLAEPRTGIAALLLALLGGAVTTSQQPTANRQQALKTSPLPSYYLLLTALYLRMQWRGLLSRVRTSSGVGGGVGGGLEATRIRTKVQATTTQRGAEGARRKRRSSKTAFLRSHEKREAAESGV
jgi:hypothetical protein